MRLTSEVVHRGDRGSMISVCGGDIIQREADTLSRGQVLRQSRNSAQSKELTSRDGQTVDCEGSAAGVQDPHLNIMGRAHQHLPEILGGGDCHKQRIG